MEGLVRVYGPLRGNSSWPRVCSGVCRGLKACGQLSGFYDLARVDDELDGSYEMEGVSSPIGLCVGPPLAASAMTGQGQHQQRLSMIAANSDWLPSAMMEFLCETTTALVAPSRWACEILDRHADGHRVVLYQHGVSEMFRPLPGVGPTGAFSVLHLASTHRERKSTRKLILAWSRAAHSGLLPHDAVLNIAADGPRGYFDEVFEEAGKMTGIRIRPRLDLPEDRMARLYQQHHAVCQPSRAEGFGLVPLEARACGVPIIATACTGHADHIETGSPGVVVIEHGPDAPVDDGPGAHAPSVTVQAIAEGLSTAYHRIDELTREAQSHVDDLHATWSWKTVSRDFVRRLV